MTQQQFQQSSQQTSIDASLCLSQSANSGEAQSMIRNESLTMIRKIFSENGSFTLDDLAWFQDNQLSEPVMNAVREACLGRSAKEVLEWSAGKKEAIEAVIKNYEKPYWQLQDAIKSRDKNFIDVKESIKAAELWEVGTLMQTAAILQNLDLQTPKGVSAWQATQAIEAILEVCGFKNHGNRDYNQHRKLSFSSFSQSFVPNQVQALVESRFPDADYGQHETARKKLLSLQNFTAEVKRFSELRGVSQLYAIQDPAKLIETFDSLVEQGTNRSYPRSVSNLKNDADAIHRHSQEWNQRKPFWSRVRAGANYVEANGREAIFEFLIGDIGNAVHARINPEDLAYAYVHSPEKQKSETLVDLLQSRKELSALHVFRRRRFNFYIGVFINAELDMTIQAITSGNGGTTTTYAPGQFDSVLAHTIEAGQFLWKPHRESIVRKIEALPVPDSEKRSLRLVLVHPNEKEKLKKKMLGRAEIQRQLQTSRSYLEAVRELSEE